MLKQSSILRKSTIEKYVLSTESVVRCFLLFVPSTIKMVHILRSTIMDLKMFSVSEPGSAVTLVSTVRELESDHEAEDLVEQSHGKNVAMWELHDEKGPRCIWAQGADAKRAGGKPVMVARSPRYAGLWPSGPNEKVLK